MANWYSNRYEEVFTFRRLSWDSWQEHESYDFITSGSIESATDSELKVTGSFDFEGYVLPEVNDLIRIYYSFTDDEGKTASSPLATLFVSYADLTFTDTTKGIKAEGTLEGSSVLSVLLEQKIGAPKTIPKNANAVYEAEQIIRSAGLLTNAVPAAHSLSIDHTFDAGTDLLEMVNWLLKTAGYREAYPDANGIVQLQPSLLVVKEPTIFANDDQSIMYPEVMRTNDWQKTPNVVRLIYNTEDACIAAFAQNNAGSRASLAARGGREITYFEEVSDLSGTSKANTLKEIAEQALRELSSDIEYVKFEHAYVPLAIFDPVQIQYSQMQWAGTVDNMSINLSPATKTQTRIKRVLTENIEIHSGSVIYRG